MTRLFNDPTSFATEAREGFAAANGAYVCAAQGGVISRTPAAAGTVAVVIGGGSGHYPAFAGFVGPGLAHGAAMGDLFASPSAQQILAIAKAAENGGGVLLGYGNYAGDVLNFTTAQEWMRGEGIACESIAVTDDIASAPPDHEAERRGIAGDLAVFKIAGAAAAAGIPLDEVARIARHANARVRSFGVAFGGCTLPGATEPLFSVPPGRMALGLGIHGEPGIEESDVPSADALAGRLVEVLLGELPTGIDRAAGKRAVPILNGLGSVKHEELFVVFRRIAELLERAGVQLVTPQVGEFCTSFEMPGASLTLVWLDPELERLWLAPAESAAFRIGATQAEYATARQTDPVGPEPSTHPTDAPTVASAASRGAAPSVLASLEAVHDRIIDAAEELGRIDAVAGDGDHGIGMVRGSRAARDAAAHAVAAGNGAGTVLRCAANAWSDRAGGTSGALWGLMLRALGDALGDREAPDAAAVASGVADAVAAVRQRGGAEPGDKTMVDALVPFSRTLSWEVTAGAPLAHAWCDAAAAAETAAAATATLTPRKGRARTHGARSLGTPDAGAHSFALIAIAIGKTLRKDNR